MKLAQLLSLYIRVNNIPLRTLADEIGTSASTLSRLANGGAMELETWLKIQAWLLSKGEN